MSGGRVSWEVQVSRQAKTKRDQVCSAIKVHKFLSQRLHFLICSTRASCSLVIVCYIYS